MINTTLALGLLADWARDAEYFWTDTPEGNGYYGTGYNSWGVQTNQKYIGALAVLAKHPDSPEPRAQALQRALAAFRFSLESHVSRTGCCSDGTQWGHTWISALGIERMMFGVHLLWKDLTLEDKTALRRVLVSEAGYLLEGYGRGAHKGITGALWNDTGCNVPESNLWNGALLWRAAAMYPDHPHCEQWKERAHRFLINAVSVPSDAENETLVAGRTVRDWFAGPNFFPNYALDHHGYLNVGYMVICTSNAAMLHFDMKASGLERPASLDHHQADLWNALRRMIFANGRLARIGGDTRVRYAYCQEYLLPALLYAADHLGETHASQLIEAQLQLIAQEAEYSGDGSFYGKRLATMKQQSPYYYTRLESDRACALAMLLSYAPLITDYSQEHKQPQQSFENSVAGSWREDEHGAVLHRSPSRFASFSWRSNGCAQGLCLPPADGHFAEWQQNLSSIVRFVGDSKALTGAPTQRRVLRHHIETFDGGFATSGEVMEGVDLTIAEGWTGSDAARHYQAFVALPDGHTVVGLEYCRAADTRFYLAELKGLHLAFANDLYNGFARRITAACGELEVLAPAEQMEAIGLGGRWANVEERLGIAGVYGASELVLHRTPRRRGGQFESLFTEEICFPYEHKTRAVGNGETLLDIGWLVVANATAQQTLAMSDSAHVYREEDLRAISMVGMDQRKYLVAFNFGDNVTVIKTDATFGDIAVEPGKVFIKANE